MEILGSVAVMLVLIVAITITEKRWEKLIKIAITIVLAATISYLIGISNNIISPNILAAIAFGTMIAYINKKNFRIFFLLAILICIFEVGMKSAGIYEIAAALPAGLLSFYLIDTKLRDTNGKRR